jgi:hypothetical protein
MKRTWTEHLFRAAFVVAVGFVCFVFGFFTPIVRYFPYYVMADIIAELPGNIQINDVFHSDMYIAATSSRTGVVQYDAERAYNGYTLFSSAHKACAYLINMKGDVIHEWHLSYDRIWKKSSAVQYPDIPASVFWRDIFLYPNGDLLAVYEGWQLHIYGFGLAKIDSNSRVIWTYLDHIHHDVTVGPDGRIYALAQAWRTTPMPSFPEIKPPRVEGFVVVLSPQGRLLKRISLFDAFARSPYRGMLRLLNVPATDEMLHTNSVKPLPPNFAKMFPQAGPNSVLISCRNLDAIALLDLDAEKIVWLMRGPWARQHDARPLPDGNIILFDDLGDFARGNHSRVLEFQPNPFKVLWEYPGDSGEVLNSEILGAEEKLPNGNVLITDSGTARLLEVTPDKKVVWEYRSPFVQGPHHEFVGVLNSAHRYAPSDLHFQFNHQTKSNTLETAKLREGSH